MLQPIIKAPGMTSVVTVNTIAYDKEPVMAKWGTHAPRSELYSYGATWNSGGMHSAIATSHPPARLATTWKYKKKKRIECRLSSSQSHDANASLIVRNRSKIFYVNFSQRFFLYGMFLCFIFWLFPARLCQLNNTQESQLKVLQYFNKIK